jgi:hypothetical protein
VAKFVSAYESADLDALVALLTDHVFMSMPPLPFEYEGREAVARLCAGIFGSGRRFDAGKRSPRVRCIRERPDRQPPRDQSPGPRAQRDPDLRHNPLRQRRIPLVRPAALAAEPMTPMSTAPGVSGSRRPIGRPHSPTRRSRWFGTRQRQVATSQLIGIESASRVLGDLLVVADDLADDEAEEFFGEGRVEPGGLGEPAQPGDLAGFASRVARWQAVDGLELPDLLRVLEAFGQNVDESCVEVVDAVAKTVQLGADRRDQDPDLGLDLLVGQCADLAVDDGLAAAAPDAGLLGRRVLAAMVHAGVIGLAIHDLPLIRSLLPGTTTCG